MKAQLVLVTAKWNSFDSDERKVCPLDQMDLQILNVLMTALEFHCVLYKKDEQFNMVEGRQNGWVKLLYVSLLNFKCIF